MSLENQKEKMIGRKKKGLEEENNKKITRKKQENNKKKSKIKRKEKEKITPLCTFDVFVLSIFMPCFR